MRRTALEVEQAQRSAERLREEGYRLQYNSRGYQVWYKEEYVGGAGILPSAKGPTGTAARNQKTDYFLTAVRIATRHKQERTPTITKAD